MAQSPGTQPTLGEWQLLSWFITCGLMGKIRGTVMDGGATAPGVMGAPKAEPERGPLLQEWGAVGGVVGSSSIDYFPPGAIVGDDKALGKGSEYPSWRSGPQERVGSGPGWAWPQEQCHSRGEAWE